MVSLFSINYQVVSIGHLASMAVLTSQANISKLISILFLMRICLTIKGFFSC